MRKIRLIGIISFVLFVFLCPSRAQDDVCDETYRHISDLDKAQRWDETTRLECESYLSICDPDELYVKNVLEKCKGKDQSGDQVQKPKEKPKPQPKPQPKPLPEPLPEPQPPLQDQPKEQKFSVDKDFVVFNVDGGSEMIKVSSNNLWDIVYQPSWVRIIRSGNSIAVLCGSNEGTSARLEDLVLREETGKELRISIKQNFSNDYIRTDYDLINDRDGTGGLYKLPIQSNKAWVVTTKPDWCTVTKESEAIIVKLPVNRSGAYRESKIEIALSSNPNISTYLIVQQAAASGYIKISPATRACSGYASVARFGLETDNSGTYRIEGLPDWCSISETSRNAFVIDIASNAGGTYREAHGRVIAGSVSGSFTITQEARLKYIDLSNNVINSSSDGFLTRMITVKSSGSWDIVNLPTWCVVEKITREGFSIRVMPNTSGAPRSAKFAVVSSDGIKEYINVNQK